MLAKYNIMAVSIADPNTHIIWINNANARLKALRDVEPGKFEFNVSLTLFSRVSV